MTRTSNDGAGNWVKSSYSTGSANCLQVRWCKATASESANGCVQARSSQPGTTEIGDTKHPDGPTLTVPNADWDAFLDQVGSGPADFTGRLHPVFLTDGGFTLRDSADPASPVLAYTRAEWDAFHSGVLAGELRPLASA